jgi:predicted flavoprotein YhiN
VKFLYNADVCALEQVESEDTSKRWDILLSDGKRISSDRVVLASGGLSFPAVGTDGTGHKIIQQARFRAPSVSAH